MPNPKAGGGEWRMDLKKLLWTEFTAVYIKPRTHTLRVVEHTPAVLLAVERFEHPTHEFTPSTTSKRKTKV